MDIPRAHDTETDLVRAADAIADGDTTYSMPSAPSVKTPIRTRVLSDVGKQKPGRIVVMSSALGKGNLLENTLRIPHAYILSPGVRPKGINIEKYLNGIKTGKIAVHQQLKDLPDDYYDYEYDGRVIASEYGPVNKTGLREQPVLGSIQTASNIGIGVVNALLAGRLTKGLNIPIPKNPIADAGSIGGLSGFTNFGFVNLTDATPGEEYAHTYALNPDDPFSIKGHENRATYIETQPYEDYLFLKEMIRQSEQAMGLKPPMAYNLAANNSNHWVRNNWKFGISRPINNGPWWPFMAYPKPGSQAP